MRMRHSISTLLDQAREKSCNSDPFEVVSDVVRASCISNRQKLTPHFVASRSENAGCNPYIRYVASKFIGRLEMTTAGSAKSSSAAIDPNDD